VTTISARLIPRPSTTSFCHHSLHTSTADRLNSFPSYLTLIIFNASSSDAEQSRSVHANPEFGGGAHSLESRTWGNIVLEVLLPSQDKSIRSPIFSEIYSQRIISLQVISSRISEIYRVPLTVISQATLLP